MIILNYSAALCGSGKTRWACRYMAETPGRYLFALDRREVFAASKALIHEFASTYGTVPLIVELYSQSRKWSGGVTDVRRKVREAGCEYGTHAHVIVLITHEALKSSDLSTFGGGWTCIIDEVPNFFAHTEVSIPVLRLLLQTIYTLKPVANTGWSEMRVKADAPLLTDFYQDTYLSPFGELHRKIRDGRTFAKITSWDDAADGTPCSFLTLWNPEELAPFSRVFVLGNAFEHTITYKLIKRNFGQVVRLSPFDIPGATGHPPQPRQLLIRYFAKDHDAGSAFWQDSDSGRECLRRIPWWVNAHSDRDDHYWSCNTFSYPRRDEMIGRWVSPKIAGENGLRHLTCGTFIYSAKPSDAERTAFAVFGISADEVVRSREHEDLIQMLWRSALRDFTDTRPVEFRVYDYKQAEFLRDFIVQNATHVTVTLEQIDLDLDSFRRCKRGRVRHVLDEAERQAKIERKRAQARERQQRRRAKLIMIPVSAGSLHASMSSNPVADNPATG